MNLMPQPSMQGQMLPPMSEEELEDLRQIAEAVTWEEASEILHSDDRRNYNVDIETDSTVFQDAEAEKMARMEYMRSMTEMLTVGLPAMQQTPSLAPMIKESAMFVSRSFKVGRTLEESLEEAFDGIAKQPPQQNEKAQEIEAKKALEAQKMQLEQQRMSMEQQSRQAELAQKTQESELSRAEKQQSLLFEREIKQREIQLKEQEIQLKGLELQGRSQEQQMTREAQQGEAQLKQAEFGLKRQDLMARHQDMSERRMMDKEKNRFDQSMQSGELESKLGEGLKGDVVQQIGVIAQQVDAAIRQLGEQTQQIAQALGGVAEQQAETGEALAAMARYMTAPKTIKRDGKGKAIGVEIGEAAQGDIRELVAGLQPGVKEFQRSDDGRVQGF